LLQGVGAFPSCGPDVPLLGPICEVVAEVLGPLANLELVQDVLFQANYYRDPASKFTALAQSVAFCL
jgi:palmitoyl-protein thioesterase